MANKTILLTGLTAGVVGAAGTEAALDITPKVLAVYPEVKSQPVSVRFLSTIATEVVEGKAKYLLNRKSHINKYATTDAIYKAGSVGEAVDGAVTTAGYKKSKRDSFDFTLNKSWDAGKEYDKKKDPKVLEGALIDDLGSLKSDIEEEKTYSFYETIDTDVTSTDGAKSVKYGKYVSSRDEKTVEAPALVKEVTIAAAAATVDAKKLEAIKVVDVMLGQLREIELFGKKGSDHEGYPYARGTKKAIGTEIIVTSETKNIISLDPRFIPTGSAEEIIRTNIIGVLGETPVTLDDDLEANSTKDWAIMPKGRFAPVIQAQELADEFLLFDHPTKPTRAKLLEGSGAWDNAITPFINLCRFGLIKKA